MATDDAASSARLTDLLGGEEVIDQVAERSRRIAEGIAGYRVERVLGRGGEGAVFEARSPEGERVALKVVVLEGQGEDAVARLRRSVGALAGLEHPGLAPPRRIILGSRGFAVLVMDLIEGAPLDAHLAGQARGRVRRALEVGRAVAAALEHCHAAGVLHLDVKPRNVLVRPSGEPVLVDFGAAREVRASQLTASFEAKGTIGFMAPELLTPGSRVDGRADVFALGQTLHLAIAGRLRSPDESGAPERVEAACRGALAGEDGAPPVDAARLSACLIRATALEPAQRFESVQAFARELDAVLRGERATALSAVTRRRKRRRAALLVGAVLLLLAIAAAVAKGYAIWTEGTDYRIDLARGVVFLNAFGAPIRVEPIDFGASLANEVGHHRRGDILAVTPQVDGRPSGLHVFDVRRAGRLEGFETPLDLAREAPPGWAPLDLYDGFSQSFTLRSPHVVDLEGDGRPEVLVHACGIRWATRGLVRIDLDRRVGGAYFQYGTFELRELADVDGDGVLDALCTGYNNLVRFTEVRDADNPSVVFAVRGTALKRAGPRVEGPPGRPAIGGGFDAPLLFYHVLKPFRIGGEWREVTFSGNLAVRWQAAERRIQVSFAPAGPTDVGVRLYLDADGRFVSGGPVSTLERQIAVLGEPLRVPDPVPFVLGGERVPWPGETITRINDGIEVYTVLFAAE